jgi:ankyrin repeat protein
VCRAVSSGNLQILDLLLEASASPNVSTSKGCHALNLAAMREDLSCFLRLLSAGAKASDDTLAGAPVGNFRTEAEQLVGKVGAQREVNDAAFVELIEGYDGSPNHLQQAEYLLDGGSDPNIRTGGDVVLSCALKHNSIALTKLLLRYGARVRDTGPPPNSALFLSRGSAAEMMITHQASKELQSAVSEGNVLAIRALLEAGMDPESMVYRENRAKTEAQTLLEYAVELDEEQAVPLLHNLLERGAYLERRDDSGRTVLVNVVRGQSSVKIAEALLLHGADVFAADKDGVTAAMYAGGTGQCDALAALLDASIKSGHGRDAGLARDADGRDAMMHAVAATQANAVQLLLNRKYKMERRMVLNELFSACRRSDLEKLQKLLEISFQVFPTIAAAAEDGMENTAKATKPTLLMEAVRANCPEAAKELLKYGAPLYPCLVSKDGGQGDSAWSISIDKDNPKLIAVLREGLSQELLQLARADNLPAASNLKAEESRGLAFGPDDFAAADDKGFGVADHVVQRGSELEAWVIERGGRLLSAETRAVALLEPAKNGDYMAICRRLKAGADVGALDTAGRTVLDWSIVAARMNGFVWHAVEAALVTVLSEGDGERSEYGGSETPDVAATPRSSKGPVIKTSFAPTVDEIEPDAVNAGLQRIGSTDRVSVTGFSACSSPHGSSSGNRHVRRKKARANAGPTPCACGCRGGIDRGRSALRHRNGTCRSLPLGTIDASRFGWRASPNQGRR